MENCVLIGGKIEKQTADNLIEYVQAVFKSGHETHMEQATIVEALNLLPQIVSVEGTSIANCVFTGEKHLNVDMDGDNKAS